MYQFSVRNCIMKYAELAPIFFSKVLGDTVFAAISGCCFCSFSHPCHAASHHVIVTEHDLSSSHIVCVCVCACVRACVRARARVCVCARALMHAGTCLCVCLCWK